MWVFWEWPARRDMSHVIPPALLAPCRMLDTHWKTLVTWYLHYFNAITITLGLRWGMLYIDIWHCMFALITLFIKNGVGWPQKQHFHKISSDQQSGIISASLSWLPRSLRSEAVVVRQACRSDSPYLYISTVSEYFLVFENHIFTFLNSAADNKNNSVMGPVAS